MQTYLLETRTLPWPVDWTAEFGRAGPLLVEIGFGGGHFLVDWAVRRSDANLIGVEISLPAIRRAQRKLRNRGMEHVRLLATDAQTLFWALCAPESVAEVAINFPDPWPKAGHQNRRLIQPRFLQLLATRMSPGGLLDIATDHADYQQAILEALTASPYFTSRQDVPFKTAAPDRLQTKYEQIALQEGRICHYYKWVRNGTAAARPFPVPEEKEMPHVVVESPLSLTEIEAAYTPFRADETDVHLNFMEMYRAQNRRKLFIETFVQETPTAQRVGLLIRERDDGRLILSIHDVGFPRPTAGLQAAVRHLARWLINLAEGTQVLQHNLGVL